MENANYFPVPDFKETDFKSFIEYWRTYYTYNPDKEEKYYLNPIAKEKLELEDLQLLFEWKNGSILSGLKQISFDNKVGNFLNEINELKAKGITSVEDVRKITPKLSSAIWLIFLTHIIDGEKFPIYDMHVYRAHNYLVNKTIQEIPLNDKKKLFHYENYLTYFNDLKPQIENHKHWDEAMWGFGKYLSRFKNLSNEEIR
ncbi:hypothetical protein HQN86_24850 [Pedobacter panaciterrae]|uniref:hypothetical protein n=1 Tax=Pedobacter panaciterrae TaxID=363849 RepID=UPI00155DAE0B|nr:hypothetical protein [Pedobacter panaciterrae]NQX56870.1 hypothetical protein [Pedobacter panaciterrae]